MLIRVGIQSPCFSNFVLILAFTPMHSSIGKSFSRVDNQLFKVGKVWSFTEAKTQIRRSLGGLTIWSSKNTTYLMQTGFPLEKL